MKICILLGYPGSGKGTLAQSLDPNHYVYFSFGDFLRNEIRKKTEIGNKHKNEVEMINVKEVNLLPEEFVRSVLKEKITELAKTKKTIILDGFPKTVEQAQFLEEILRKEKMEAIYVFISVPSEVLEQRILQRVVCLHCNQIYNLLSNPPKNAEICDVCHQILSIRGTDTQENIQTRIRFYDRIMQPLLSHYQEKGMLIELNGNAPMSKTISDFTSILQKSDFRKA